ncbi:DUF2189 domain-containing protein [Marinihelvus fidelis]|uniref:DUF2189 domain-containing protein n=1 Tax=Marinihelvus fidelis TaxID=2613842 RepID=A0A5N0TC93_9GAMM|nr:DUF2189 domain-containing protein [Marinihelvus fidelis]KAA9132580.1 DUF2189 domain-containing protein [Marinihelvus fidelis]
MNTHRDPAGRDIAADSHTVIAPCRKLNLAMPIRWLRAGWQDYRAVPRVSLAYGMLVFAISAVVSWLGWTLGGWVLLLTLLTGFVFVAPLLAFGLYSVARQRDAGNWPSMARSLLDMRRPVQNAMVFGLLLLVVFLVWARAGSMVHIFASPDSTPGWMDVLRFFAIGSAVGAVFAGFTFAASAFSLPMLANRNVDVITAVLSSINAVMRNKLTCAAWALTLLLLTAVGVATALLGLIIVIPWLAYASWHAYRDVLVVDAWAPLPIEQENTHES